MRREEEQKKNSHAASKAFCIVPDDPSLVMKGLLQSPCMMRCLVPRAGTRTKEKQRTKEVEGKTGKRPSATRPRR